MKFILRTKNAGQEHVRKEIEKLLEEKGAEWTHEMEKGCDFAVIIGGDGTLMRDQGKANCPLLGIKKEGSVGYYMSADYSDFREKILKLVEGKAGEDYMIKRFMRLTVSVNGKPLDGLALNDVLVSAVYTRRIFEAMVNLCGDSSVERNSGIIVYTPSGSHAFAHSAGASRMPEESRKLGVAGLAPYSGCLKKQEILLEKGPVEIECMSPEGEICVDGSETQIMKIKKGDTVTIDKSADDLEMVAFGGKK